MATAPQACRGSPDDPAAHRNRTEHRPRGSPWAIPARHRFRAARHRERSASAPRDRLEPTTARTGMSTMQAITPASGPTATPKRLSAITLPSSRLESSERCSPRRFRPSSTRYGHGHDVPARREGVRGVGRRPTVRMAHQVPICRSGVDQMSRVTDLPLRGVSRLTASTTCGWYRHAHDNPPSLSRPGHALSRCRPGGHVLPLSPRPRVRLPRRSSSTTATPTPAASRRSGSSRRASSLRIGYSHTSHGSQLVTGLEALRAHDGQRYAFTASGWGLQQGVFLNDGWANDWAGDLGSGGDLAWRNATVQALARSGDDRNVVMWSWCGGVSDNTVAGIDAYLNAMEPARKPVPGRALRVHHRPPRRLRHGREPPPAQPADPRLVHEPEQDPVRLRGHRELRSGWRHELPGAVRHRRLRVRHQQRRQPLGRRQLGLGVARRAPAGMAGAGGRPVRGLRPLRAAELRAQGRRLLVAARPAGRLGRLDGPGAASPVHRAVRGAPGGRRGHQLAHRPGGGQPGERAGHRGCDVLRRGHRGRAPGLRDPRGRRDPRVAGPARLVAGRRRRFEHQGGAPPQRERSPGPHLEDLQPALVRPELRPELPGARAPTTASRRESGGSCPSSRRTRRSARTSVSSC